MLRSRFEFASVLFIIFLSSTRAVSFGDWCSPHLLCQHSLVCSNISRCGCARSTSFWNRRQNACVTCPQGWLEWRGEKCLLFVAPLQNGIRYEDARNVCRTQSAQLLSIQNDKDLVQFQQKIEELLQDKRAAKLMNFLSEGVWLNTPSETKYGGSMYSWDTCIRLRKQFANDGNDTSLCLGHVQCNETLSYICEKSVRIDGDHYDGQHQERFFNLVSDLVGGLLFPTAPPPTQTQAPQIIYMTNPPPVLPQTSKSDNTWLIIGIAAIVIILISVVLCCCCCGGGLLLWQSDQSSSKTAARLSRRPGQRNRTSVDSAVSDGTY